MSVSDCMRFALIMMVMWLSAIQVLVTSQYMVDKTKAVVDKALYGYAFRNLTMNTVDGCIINCFEDCFCMAFQMCKNTECQLLSSNQFQTPSALVTMKGCSYYDMLPTKSHHGASCTPQCECRENPCKNGGRCESFFPTDYTTARFKCNCPPGYAGKFCENMVQSCRGYINGSRVPGIYQVFNMNSATINLYDVFCDFDSTMAWTLIQSYQLRNKDSVTKYGFNINLKVRKNFPGFDEHRLTYHRMQSIQDDSSKWRITCKYDTDGVVYRDYLQATNYQLDILTFNDDAQCILVESIDVRGQGCTNCTTYLFQNSNIPLHVNTYWSKYMDCDFQPTGSKYCGGGGENNFGVYDCVNSAHRCSSSPSATTQIWFGGQ